MRDVETLGFEAFVDSVACVPKSQIICKCLDLLVRNNRVHVLRRCCCWRGILEAKPNRAAPINDEGNLVIKSFIECEEQMFRVAKTFLLCLSRRTQFG